MIRKIQMRSQLSRKDETDVMSASSYHSNGSKIILARMLALTVKKDQKDHGLNIEL